MKTLNIKRDKKENELLLPCIMGIINVNDQSFYAPSRATEIEAVILKAGQMVNEGARILDIGAASTQPGAKLISAKEEKARLSPILPILREKFPNTIFSIDTYNSETAKMAAEAGVDIINDISSGMIDHKMISTVAELQLPYIAMHMKGVPETMQNEPDYEDVVEEVLKFFKERILYFEKSGIKDIIVDPGFGFGKSVTHNYQLLSRMEEIGQLGKPILVGLSRKSMLYKILNKSPEESLIATSAANVIALMKGAQILRVHDVSAAMDCLAIYKATKNF